MKQVVVLSVLVLVVLSWIPFVVIAYSRTAHSRKPPLHVFLDMDDQPKYKSQRLNPLFADRREQRPQVDGTVARGQIRDDSHLYEGAVGGEWVATIPFAITDAVMKRGQERYGIYCAACHGLSGNGNGMVAVRAEELAEGTWVPPTDLRSDTVRDRSVGHLYNTIANGIRNMPAYGKQIDVADRWAIVAYMRALQRSQRAAVDDVPEPIRPSLR
jgi:mono/diheme cytochrome c family protein